MCKLAQKHLENEQSKFPATISLYGACSEDILVQGGALGTRVNPDTIGYVWTGKCLYPERKSCRFKNIPIRVDWALKVVTVHDARRPASRLSIYSNFAGKPLVVW